MKSWLSKMATPLAFVLIVGAGLAIYLFFTANRPQPPRLPRHAQAAMVETAPARAPDRPAVVSAMGVVIPARSVAIIPEVSGQVVYVNPRLVPGGRIRKDEVLVKIDPRDYELALEQQQANLARAEMELARERGLKSVAEREWQLIEKEVQPTEEGKKLALREIQLRTAVAAVASARSALEQARLRLEKTTLLAPFNALVTEKSIDAGQVVGPSSRVATLVGTDEFWVRVNLPASQLPFILIPGQRGHRGEGSPARVIQQLGSEEVVRPARVIQLMGELDPRGKTARLLVAVPDPLGAGENDVPLLLGSYVAVEIEGPTLSDTVAVPRQALIDNNRVLVMSGQSTLEVRQVDLVWLDKDTAFVRGNLKEGEEVILTRLAAPVPGMALRRAGDWPNLPASKPTKTVSSGKEAS